MKLKSISHFGCFFTAWFLISKLLELIKSYSINSNNRIRIRMVEKLTREIHKSDTCDVSISGGGISSGNSLINFLGEKSQF